MKAPWKPPWIPVRSAQSATTVLPEPTSPCSSRFIGRGAGEVPLDLVNSVTLRLRELEAEPPPELSDQIAGRRVGTDRVAYAPCIALGDVALMTTSSCNRSSSSKARRWRALVFSAQVSG
jgi:hypothetical protein